MQNGLSPTMIYEYTELPEIANNMDNHDPLPSFSTMDKECEREMNLQVLYG